MKKKFLKVIITASVILISLLPLSANAAISGDGSAETPFVVTTQEELLLVSDFPDCCFELGNDIELTGKWTPLCTYSDAFTGVFDGKGYTISNLQITNFKNSGLFATNSGTIKNLNVKTSETGITFNSSTDNDTSISILVAINKGTLSDCNVEGKIIYRNTFYSLSSNNTYTANIGGICAQNSGTIKNATATITSEDIIAHHSTPSGYMGLGTVYIGGITGQNSYMIEKCISNNNFSVSDGYIAYMGGIAGINSSSEVIISQCSATGILDDGDATARSYIGGISGKHLGQIDNSYFIGSLSGLYASGIAGTGAGSIINNCYACSETTASTNKGIIYFSGTVPEVTNSFYDQTVSGASDTGYGVPKSTLAMKMKATYKSWDFENVWGIDEGINNGYPYLLFELNSLDDSVTFDHATQKASIFVKEAGTYTVIFADYESNTFTAADIQPLTLKKGYNNDIPTTLTLSDGDKVFLWNSLSSMTPKCEADIVNAN